jgi:hypothetical protein
MEVNMKKLCFGILFLVFCALLAKPALARTEGFYIGGGYQQPFAFTWKSQGTLAGNPSPGSKITFWPGFGGFIIAGYDFQKVDWFGLAFPVNWSMTKLNKSEWVHSINADGEAVFHLGNSENKLDPFITGIIGFNYMLEGSVKNESQSFGPAFGASFGIKYTLIEYAMAGSPRVTNLSLYAEVPVKIWLIVNDYDLSDSSITPILQIPVRVGVTYSF